MIRPIDMATQAIKTAVKKGVSVALEHTGAYRDIHKGRLLILLFHRVVPDEAGERDFLLPSIVATPGALSRCLTHLRERHDVISFDDYFRLQETGWDPTRRYAIVTFDDGWADSYEHALPVLRRLDIPATFFVCPGMTESGESFWWYRLLELLARRRKDEVFIRELSELLAGEAGAETDIRRYMRARRGAVALVAVQRVAERIIARHAGEAERWLAGWKSSAAPVLTWRQMEEMSGAGMSFGPHTQRHAILTGVPLAEARREIEASWRALQNRSGVRTTPVFSYPSGCQNTDVQNLVRDAGLRAAVAVDQRVNRLPPSNPYALARINVDRRSAASPSLFKLVLARARPI